jgi:putative transposase
MHPGVEEALARARCPDAYRLKLDFLPYEERSVQRYGLALDGVHYYSDVLRRWIDSRGPDGSKTKAALPHPPRSP